MSSKERPRSSCTRNTKAKRAEIQTAALRGPLALRVADNVSGLGVI